MAGYNHGSVIDPVQYTGDVGGILLDVAARANVHEREAVLEIVVPHVHHVLFDKKHDAVTVGMSPGIMLDLQLITVEMQNQGVAVGHDRQSGRRTGFDHPIEKFHFLAGGHTLVDVGVGQYHRAALTPVSVAAHVIRVPVGVDNKARQALTARKRLQRLVIGCGVLGVVVVDDQNAVLTYRGQHIATLALQ